MISEVRQLTQNSLDGAMAERSKQRFMKLSNFKLKFNTLYDYIFIKVSTLKKNIKQKKAKKG